LACLPFIPPTFALGDCTDKTNASLERLSQVIDGDTLRLADGHLLRFVGINAPEIDHQGNNSEPLAKHAKALLKKAIGESLQVWLVPDAQTYDRHQRRLAHVLNQQGENLQVLLLSQGLAFHIAIPPNLRWQRCYRDAEQKARQQGLGIWSQSYFQARDIAAVKPGFQRLRLTAKEIRRRGAWQLLQVSPTLDLRIHRKNLHYFPKDLHSLLKPMVVRGWLSQRKGHWSMQLQHPAAIEMLDDTGQQ